jgi:hypothetical protein
MSERSRPAAPLHHALCVADMLRVAHMDLAGGDAVRPTGCGSGEHHAAQHHDQGDDTPSADLMTFRSLCLSLCSLVSCHLQAADFSSFMCPGSCADPLSSCFARATRSVLQTRAVFSQRQLWRLCTGCPIHTQPYLEYVLASQLQCC